MLAVDSETTGLDFFHGSKPFLVTMCNKNLENTWWEWDVNPITRKPHIPKKDKKEIKDTIKEQELIFHNSKFDVKGLDQIKIECDWDYLHDTLIMAHIVDSGFNKSLTALTLEHLELDVQPFENEIKEATNAARRIVRSNYPEWVIATTDNPTMPSINSGAADDNDKPWKSDMWLPRAIAQEENYPDDHPWWTVCSSYANSDTATTIQLYSVLENIIKAKGLWNIYLERLKVLPILYQMEIYGITVNKDRLEELKKTYTQEYKEKSSKCGKIAKSIGFNLELPVGAINNSLREFCFDSDKLNLPVVKTTKKGNASLDKEAKEIYLLTLQGIQKDFIEALDSRSKLATSLGFMESYKKFMVGEQDSPWAVLHSSLNPTGTATLRMSSKNPNQQQISKLTDSNGRNLRYIFGPSPEKEWWSLDYDNLELRIPAYECKEPAMLELFEHPNKAPYFGSYHLLVSHILYPEKFNSCKDGDEFKNKYKTTYYHYTKAGNFADMYGAVNKADGTGTADKAYHLPGAQSIIAARLKEKSKLNEKYKAHAQQYGFVTTMIDKVINPKKGYPLTCPSNSWGKVKPTVPLNYHVQGTACWIMMRAMIKVQEYLTELGSDYKLIMNVHDELSVEMPFKDRKGNLPKVEKVKKLMESIGEDVGVKLTCGIDYHPNNWNQTVC